MKSSRRNFLAGSVIAAGSVPVLGAAAGAKAPVVSGPREYFGSPLGYAQLSRNENPYGPAPSALKAIAETAPDGSYYADRGAERLTMMIAERHGVSPAQVVLGEGSTEILCSIAMQWGRDGKILCPDLFWDTTVIYGERFGASRRSVPLTPAMQTDLPAMRAAMGEDIALVQICNPNNPTGMVLEPAALRAFASSVAPQATLLVDEAYNELADDPEAHSCIDLVKAGQDVIVCRTFSKIYGMAGMRVGYAITSEANAERIRQGLMSFGGNVSGLAAAIASYNDTAFLDSSRAAVAEGRQMIMAAVKAAGLTALPSQTNFVYVKVPDADKVRKAMAERNVLIRGAYGDWTQYSRVSCGRIEDVKRYCDALPGVVDGLKA